MSHTLHIALGGKDNDDQKEIDRVAGTSKTVPVWTVPKRTQPGDRVVIHLAGVGLYAVADAASTTGPRRGWKNRYATALTNFRWISPPISIEDLKRRVPELKWANYPRSITTPTESVAKTLLRLIQKRTGSDLGGQPKRARIDSGKRLRDIRHDANAAAKALAALIPDERTRVRVAQTLAASIRCAHRQAPKSWVLTGWPGKVRLNVGQIAVADVDSSELRMYTVAGRSLRSHGYQKVEWGSYRAVDVPTEGWRVPLAGGPSTVKPLLERHRALIQVAAQAKRISPFKRAHSPAFVEAIGRLIGSTLPQPGYDQLDDEPQDLESATRACFGQPESNKKIERAAVNHVTKQLQSQGWHVISVEGEKCGFDLNCSRGKKQLHVEVKGVAGAPDRFILTANEMRTAESDRLFRLALVGRSLTSARTLESWTRRKLLRTFTLAPLQYFARRTLPTARS